VVHYQPIVAEAAGGSVAIEALARWPSAEQGTWISPVEFISVAEENGLIVRLGEWILRSACQQFAQWRRAGVRLQYVSVNVSVRQLRQPDYLATLSAALRDSGMQASELQVEITESVLAHGAEVYDTLTRIAALGVRLALDDFGTGYSSLSYVHAYPFHTIKIDRAFVSGLPGDAVSCKLAESIIVMCTALGMNVVAEGVETEAQREFLRQAGCTTVQGYLVARPMAAADLPEFVRRLEFPPHIVTPEDSSESLPMRQTA
jgi:EAL domain-containing protein (putative c-di-GMP-specific phosphodiesterase class I)